MTLTVTLTGNVLFAEQLLPRPCRNLATPLRDFLQCGLFSRGDPDPDGLAFHLAIAEPGTANVFLFHN